MLRLVDRVLFGHRRDPYAVLSHVRGRLDLATGPVDALAQLADGLRAALRLPYVAVESNDERLPVITAGSMAEALDRLPARDHGEQLGVLVIGHRRSANSSARPSGAPWARWLGASGNYSAHAALFHDVQNSRERLVLRERKSGGACAVTCTTV